MLTIKTPQLKKLESYHEAKLIDASADELVIECNSERFELQTHGFSRSDEIGKTGRAQHTGEGDYWAFIPY